jgi:hypothetical protein
MPRLASQLFIALLFNLCAVVGSQAQDWEVVRVTGLVWVVKADMEPMRATAGMILPENATVATTSASRAMLRHGEDVLNVGPSTHVAPQARPVHGLTTVLMRQGNLELDIEKLGAPHFTVQTPVLAAVVKGTRFRVAVSGDNGAVSVETGRVQVTALAAGQAVDVTNGQTASLSGGSLEVAGSGPHASIQSVAPQAPVVEATAAADDTSGGASETSASATASGRSLSNAGGNSASAAASSNAGGNSANTNSNSNAGGNSGNSNAGGIGKGKDKN